MRKTSAIVREFGARPQARLALVSIWFNLAAQPHRCNAEKEYPNQPDDRSGTPSASDPIDATMDTDQVDASKERLNIQGCCGCFGNRGWAVERASRH
jgi:hypothetical protein